MNFGDNYLKSTGSDYGYQGSDGPVVFWGISLGIVCGAEMLEIAVIRSLVLNLWRESGYGAGAVGAQEEELVGQLSALPKVGSVSLMSHDGEVTF